MRRETLHYRDGVWSQWHRVALDDDAGMIDADWIEYCRGCRAPVAVWETTFDRGQTKPAWMTRCIAERFGIPGAVVFYTRTDEPCACQPHHLNPACAHGIESVRVHWLTPECRWSRHTGREFAAVITDIHQRHECATADPPW